MEEGLTDDLSYELGTTSGEEMQNFIENSSVVMDNATMDSGSLCNFGGFQVYFLSQQLFARKIMTKLGILVIRVYFQKLSTSSCPIY